MAVAAAMGLLLGWVGTSWAGAGCYIGVFFFLFRVLRALSSVWLVVWHDVMGMMMTDVAFFLFFFFPCFPNFSHIVTVSILFVFSVNNIGSTGIGSPRSSGDLNRTALTAEGTLSGLGMKYRCQSIECSFVSAPFAVGSCINTKTHKLNAHKLA